MALKLTPEQQLNFLDLYRYEIKSRLAKEHFSLEPLKDLINEKKFEELYEEVVKNGSWTQFSESLWVELRNSPMNKILYPAILRFLSKVDLELHQRINLNNYEHEFVVGFKKLLFYIPEILEIMNLLIVMDTLKNISGNFFDIIQPIYDRLQICSIGIFLVCRVLKSWMKRERGES